MLTVGVRAPDFELKTSQGYVHKLSDYKAKTVVLYFYPKDDTPGCTKEACNFKDNIKLFQAKNAVIIGISADDEESHEKFKKKYDLPFTLLADTEKKVIKEYGVWQEKSMYGKKYMGIVRTTFIIDKNRVIRRIFEKVKPENHWAEVLEVIKK